MPGSVVAPAVPRSSVAERGAERGAEAHFAAIEAESGGSDDAVWCDPVERCDVCRRPMAGETFMIDGPAELTADPRRGYLCAVCAIATSRGIGWGYAQLYRRIGVGWHLVAGGPSAGASLDYQDIG